MSDITLSLSFATDGLAELVITYRPDSPRINLWHVIGHAPSNPDTPDREAWLVGTQTLI